MNISALTLFRTRTGWRLRLSDGVRARGVIRVMVAWLGKRAEHLDQRPSGMFTVPMGAGEEGPAQVEARQVPDSAAVPDRISRLDRRMLHRVSWCGFARTGRCLGPRFGPRVGTRT